MSDPCIYVDINEWDDRFAIQYDCYGELYIESEDKRLRRELEKHSQEIKQLLEQLTKLLKQIAKVIP